MGELRNVVVSAADPERTYTSEEEYRLTQHLLELTTAIHGGRFSHLLGQLRRMLEAFHYNIFRDVRSHAGRPRAPGTGSERLTFGPHLSTHRDLVSAELDGILGDAEREITVLAANPDHQEYERRATEIAVRMHADLIRVHPFEDGNGRSCRAIMNAALVGLGLRPVAIETPKQEYIDALNHYYNVGDAGPLLGLVERLLDESDLMSEDPVSPYHTP